MISCDRTVTFKTYTMVIKGGAVMKGKKLLSVLAVLMVILVATGTSLAYMSDRTNLIINTFAASPSLEAELREPAWDGITFGQDTTDQGENPALGMNMAKAYTPNMVLPKDPAIKNKNEEAGMDEWVAIRVSYVDENGINARTYIKDDQVPFDQEHWLQLASDEKDVEYYIYKSVLKPQTITEPLFDHVQIKPVLEEETSSIFNIEVKGFALQGTMEFEEAKELLLSMMK